MSVYYQQSVWSSVVSAQTVEKDAAMTDAATRLDSVRAQTAFKNFSYRMFPDAVYKYSDYGCL